MIPRNQIAPREIDSNVSAFCERLCIESTPIFVPVVPEPGAKHLECHPNVDAKVKIAGGRNVYGWQISESPGIFLEAQFHSIWESPTGEFLDISPEELGHTKILFLPDPHRSYNGTRVPLERHALGDPQIVERYCELLESSSRIFQDLISKGFRVGDPVFHSQIGPLMTEIMSIRQKLQPVESGRNGD